MDIVNRIYGYDNQQMVDYCQTLLSVMQKKKTIKSGSGKTAKVVEVPKYTDKDGVVAKINNSIEYYGSNKFEFRDYQSAIIDRGSAILLTKGFLYLSMEVRTGKTLTSMGIAEKVKAKEVLFITKKKAISSIQNDYATLSPSFNLCVINYESLHTVMDDSDWDLIVCDEAHSMGAYPKPSERAKLVGQVIRKYRPRVILMSGTPTPESYSQMYHQVYSIPGNPFAKYPTFYKFCADYVKIRQQKINGMLINNYDNGLEKIIDEMRPYTINYTQAEAGFITQTTEEILEVELKPSTYSLIDRLKKDLVVEGKRDVILADTPVKLMMKLHQLYSGTIKFESGNSMVIDTTKAEFIKERFSGIKIGIFYKFKEELSALKEVFKDDLTTELNVFENTDKSIALQIVSGREGLSLRQAKFLVYYNIDFSATSYWQSRDRMTTKDRLENKVYWIFSKGGIEYDVYDAVIKKKDYTVNHFKKQQHEIINDSKEL